MTNIKPQIGDEIYSIYYNLRWGTVTDMHSCGSLQTVDKDCHYSDTLYFKTKNEAIDHAIQELTKLKG